MQRIFPMLHLHFANALLTSSAMLAAWIASRSQAVFASIGRNGRKMRSFNPSMSFSLLPMNRSGCGSIAVVVPKLGTNWKIPSCNPLNTMREESEPLPLCSKKSSIAFSFHFRTLYLPFYSRAFLRPWSFPIIPPLTFPTQHTKQ